MTEDYSGDDKMALKHKAVIICEAELAVIRETVSRGPNTVEKGGDGPAFAGVCYRGHCMGQTT